jgi:hypothetical protein
MSEVDVYAELSRLGNLVTILRIEVKALRVANEELLRALQEKEENR